MNSTPIYMTIFFLISWTMQFIYNKVKQTIIANTNKFFDYNHKHTSSINVEDFFFESSSKQSHNKFDGLKIIYNKKNNCE